MRKEDEEPNESLSFSLGEGCRVQVVASIATDSGGRKAVEKTMWAGTYVLGLQGKPLLGRLADIETTIQFTSDNVDLRRIVVGSTSIKIQADSVYIENLPRRTVRIREYRQDQGPCH